MHLGLQLYLGIFQCGDIQRLPDAAFLQQIGAQQLVGVAVIADAALTHDHHPVHLAVEHVLQTVLDDDHGAAGALLDLVDQLDGLLSGGRVQIGQRLVKEQHIHLSHHDAAKAHPLLLSAGDLVGRMVQNLLYANHAGSLPHLSVHVLPLHTVVFQGKGNVLGHRQADELAVGVLQDGAHDLAQAKQTQ